MLKITPVILCGGSGTRLWPVSRSQYPKQFMLLSDGSTLFTETLRRTDTLSHRAEPIIVSNEACRFYASSALREEGRSGTVILEPASRNTAPAIALAAFAAMEQGDSLLLVLPSDHRFEDTASFCAAVEKARASAEERRIVTFGIQPSCPETGYGYIRKGEPVKDGEELFHVAAFLEKPELAQAESMLASGAYLWNSGIFFVKASTYLEELQALAPAVWEAVRNAWEARRADLSFLRPGEAFLASPNISIDYAVMEKTERAVVVPVACGWNDLGSWDSFYEVSEKDAHGNACEGDVIIENSSNCYLRSSGRLIAALDVHDLAVVETRDAILVADRRKAQEVKQVVEKLKQEKRPESDNHLKVYRPWGSYETLVLSDRFQVKRIVVNPGEENSLQMHYHRAEHWIVVSGTAQVTVGDEVRLLSENESIYISLGKEHRIKNPGTIPLVFIEVQSGAYLGEDDIVRLQDDYGRAEGPAMGAEA
ncbi:MAG: mannose-1-phosphate guanylyltransferase/mannose-6-phosphate isomerase [Mailhella sp.]|nr:mannose-1-phosphate guanylyltransferase/mannose-6-phosphate isomerase [Mailhella sp.]